MSESTSVAFSDLSDNENFFQPFYPYSREPVLGQELIRVVRQTDRRTDHRRAAMYSLVKRRRRGLRREDEQGAHAYIDVHESWLFYLALVACMLSVIDAFLTLRLLEHGSQELNPVLDYFLAKDVRLFFGVKFLLTCFCITFLVMHKNYLLLNRISGLHILVGSICGYSLLVLYELGMLTVVHLG